MNKTNMDTTIKPADDFFRYINGGWIKNTKIPYSTLNILRLHQGGLNLPNRDYYLDKENKKIKDAYKDYITILFQAIGNTNQKQFISEAQQIIDLETVLARSHIKQEDLRVVKKNYNKVNLQDLKETTAIDLPWKIVFENLGVQVDFVDISQSKYYAQLYKFLKKIR